MKNTNDVSMQVTAGKMEICRDEYDYVYFGDWKIL